MEITKQNITDADLDFLNFLRDRFEIAYGWEICHCSETISRLLREEFYKTSLLNEMDEFKMYHLNSDTEEKMKDYYLKAIFEKIDIGSESELCSDYINNVSYHVETVNELINGLSRYFLEKKVIKMQNKN